MDVNEDASLDSFSYQYYGNYWEEYLFDSLDELADAAQSNVELAEEGIQEAITSTPGYNEAKEELDLKLEEADAAKDLVESIQKELEETQEIVQDSNEPL
jgi:capsule polysaccharide export protein KpsE/RkpR